MVDVTDTTLHKRTSEGGWLATLSTPWISPCDASKGVVALLVGIETGFLSRKSFYVVGFLSDLDTWLQPIK